MSQGPNDQSRFRAEPPRKVETGFTADRPPEPSAVKPSLLRRSLRWLPALSIILLLSGCAGLIFFVDTCYNPTDRVSVSITHLPDRERFVCVVSDSHGQTQLMKRYFTGIPILPPEPVGPQAMPCATQVPATAEDHLVWVFGDRYGVVTETGEKWHVTWFNADEAPLDGRSTLFGRGNVTFDLDKARMEPLSNDEAAALGLRRP